MDSEPLKDEDYEGFRKRVVRYLKAGEGDGLDVVGVLMALDELISVKHHRRRRGGGFDDVESWRVLRDRVRRQAYEGGT